MADEEKEPNSSEEPAPAPEVSADSSPADPKAAEALAAAQAAIAALNEEPEPEPAASAAASVSAAAATSGSAPRGEPGAKPFDLPDFGGGSTNDLPAGISMLADVNLNVKIELGRTRMNVENVLRLAEGSVVELDKLAGDPVDVFVNDRHIARGEVLVLNDNFCVRISEIIAPLAAAAAAEAAAA